MFFVGRGKEPYCVIIKTGELTIETTVCVVVYLEHKSSLQSVPVGLRSSWHRTVAAVVDAHSLVRWSWHADSHHRSLLPAPGPGRAVIGQGMVVGLAAAFETLPGRIPYHRGSFWR